jgi:hypothetical protein
MHARYLVKNPEAAPHDEDEKLAGYSEAGKKAAGNSVVGRPGNPLADIPTQLTTLYHRQAVLNPSTRTIGIGFEPGTREFIVVTDVLSDTVENGDSPEIICYPPNSSSGHPFMMNPENPTPVEDALRNKVGLPVTAIFYKDPEQVTAASGKLFELGGKEREIECFLSTPEKPASQKVEQNAGIIALIPKSGLKANTKYRVVIECRHRDKPLKLEWTFTTGASAWAE